MRFAAETAAICLALSPVSALARDSAQITPASIEAHVRFLADDLLEGRDDGTAGHEIAARYVMAQFMNMGLEPGNGHDWYQRVPLVLRGRDDAAPATLSIDGKSLDSKDALAWIEPEAVNWSGEVVFAGHGVSKPEIGVDELAGIDVRGKLVAVFSPKPDKWDILNYEIEQKLAKQGAVGLLYLPPLDPSKQHKFWDLPLSPRKKESEDRPAYRSPFQFVGWMRPEYAEKLFDGAAASYGAVADQAGRGQPMKAFPLKTRVSISGARPWLRVRTPNVLGLIRGSDARLGNEVVIVTAHLDHVGRIRQNGPDWIFNGAMDNAAGVASLLEVARALKQGKAPRRTILFVATTAEEDGKLGSEYLADHMPAGLDNLVAVVNMDMPILTYDFTDVTAMGAEDSTLGPVARKVAKRMGISIVADPLPDEHFERRSDQWSFASKGVPFLAFMTGSANGGAVAIKHFLNTKYHQPSDDLSQPIHWAAGARYASLNLETIRAIANDPARPAWYEDSSVGKTYAPKAAKVPRRARPGIALEYERPKSE